MVNHVCEQRQDARAILMVNDNALHGIAKIDHMIDGTGKINPQWVSHEAGPKYPNALGGRLIFHPLEKMLHTLLEIIRSASYAKISFPHKTMNPVLLISFNFE